MKIQARGALASTWPAADRRATDSGVACSCSRSACRRRPSAPSRLGVALRGSKPARQLREQLGAASQRARSRGAILAALGERSQLRATSAVQRRCQRVVQRRRRSPARVRRARWRDCRCASPDREAQVARARSSAARPARPVARRPRACCRPAASTSRARSMHLPGRRPARRGTATPVSGSWCASSKIDRVAPSAAARPCRRRAAPRRRRTGGG